jgi:RNA polymerase sigma factor (sigma-70 family)
MERPESKSSSIGKKEKRSRDSKAKSDCSLPLEEAFRFCNTFIGRFHLGYDNEQDVIQNAIVNSYRIFLKYDKPAESFIPYVRQAVIYGAIDCKRRRNRFVPFEIKVDTLELASRCSFDIVEDIRRKKKILEEFLAEEDQLGRKILKLRLKEWTLPEIYEELGITEEKEKEKIRRLYYKIRNELKRRYSEDNSALCVRVR